MTKSELAQLYLPYYTSKSALNRMMAWIIQSPDLMAELLATGYKTRQKTLTPQQVEIIYGHLGRP